MTYDIEVPDAVFQRIDDEEIRWLIVPECREMQCLDRLLLSMEEEHNEDIKSTIHCQIDHITWRHPKLTEGFIILSISKIYDDK